MCIFFYREPSVVRHLTNVYITFIVAILLALLGLHLHLNDIIVAGPLTVIAAFIAILIMIFILLETRTNQLQRFCSFYIVALLWGINMGLVVEEKENLDIFEHALVSTIICFTGITMSALLSPTRYYLGSFIYSALLTLFYLEFVNVFLQSRFIFKFGLHIGLWLYCIYVFDHTQNIVEGIQKGNTDYVCHALGIFVIFMEILERIYKIFKEKKDSKKKNKKEEE